MKKLNLVIAGSVLAASFSASATTTVDLGTIAHPGAAATGTEFANFEADSYVYVEALQGLDFANMLMCIAGATGIPLIPNGQYLAVADLAMCSAGDGSGVPNYTQMIVDSSRASNTSPQESKVWIEYNNGGTLETIHFKANIVAPPSDLNPMGEWTLSYEFQSTPPLETGYLAATTTVAGAPKLDMVIVANDSDGSGTQTRQSSFEMTALDAGAGTVSISSTGNYYTHPNTTVVTNLAITPTHVGIDTAGTAQCLDVGTMTDVVYEYNLYDTSGDLVDISSNLEFTTGSGSHGVLGSYSDGSTVKYWIWVEQDSENGPTTTSVTDNAGVTYTLTWTSNELTRVVNNSTTQDIEFDDPLQFAIATATNISPNTSRSDSSVTFETVASSQFSGTHLTYDGPGRLYGISYVDVNDDGDATTTDPAPYYEPAVGFADGTKLVDTLGGTYYVKAANISRNPATGGTGCSAMTYTALSLPASTLAVSPAGMGTPPTVSTEPRVMDGNIIE